MTEHREYAELLAAGATLSPEEQTRLALHIAHCPECRALAAEYGWQDTFLQSLELPNPTPRLRWGVLSRIDQVESGRPARRRWRRGIALLLAPLAVAGITVGLLQTHAGPSGALPAPAPAVNRGEKLSDLQRNAVYSPASTGRKAEGVPGAAIDQHASAFFGPQSIASQVVTHGLALALYVPGDAFPRNAPVAVTVVLHNVIRHPVEIGAGAETGCPQALPWVEVINARGKALHPSVFIGEPVRPCPDARPHPLAPGRSLQRRYTVILRDAYLRAALALPTGARITTPVLAVRLVAPPRSSARKP